MVGIFRCCFCSCRAHAARAAAAAVDPVGVDFTHEKGKWG